MALDSPLSWGQVAALALTVGWAPADAVYAVAITEPESARIVNNVQAGQPYDTTGWGLWQITPGNSVPQYGIDDAMLNGLNNARAAHYKWREAGGFSPWTTYEHQLEVPYLPAAERAVAAVAKLSVTSLHRLVDSAAGGAGLSNWTPDAALIKADAELKRLLSKYNSALVSQRMAYARMGVQGWLP